MPVRRPTTVLGLAPRTSRRARMPRHPFYFRQLPWEITPFFIAPVLAGETMKKLLMQVNGVSLPLANPLIGHWLQHDFFYVKLRDLGDRDALTQMLVDPSASTAMTPAGATSEYLYTYNGSFPYVLECLKTVTEWYFRQEGEAWNNKVGTVTGLPLAKIGEDNWLQSAQWASEMEAPVDLDVDLNSDATITAREVDMAMQQYDYLKAMGMVEGTYEEYLATFGVRLAPEDIHKPELIRSSRVWLTPASTVMTNTADAGEVSSVVRFKFNVSADKDRFFKEPGFLFGVSTWRPKIYLNDLRGAAVGLLDRTMRWLPAVMSGNPSISLAEISANIALLENIDTDGTPGPADQLWIDLRDLFLHGDQWLNGRANVPEFNLPDAEGNSQYVTASEADNVGVAAANAAIDSDGIVMATIMGHQMDATVSNPVPNRS